MYIVIDDSGFLQYATPFLPVKEKYIEIEPNDAFVKPQFVNNEWVEGATQQEINAIIDEKKAALKKEYSDKIDAVVNEFVQKKIITGEEIPEEIKQKWQQLIYEFNNKILNL